MRNGDQLVLHGPVGADHSISKVLRETALALNRLGYPVGVFRTDLRGGWGEPRYAAMMRNLLVDRPGALNYAPDTYRGSGMTATQQWIDDLPGRRGRGFLFDKFECDASFIKASRGLDLVAAPSQHALSYLRAQGVENSIYAPFGVNPRDYYPVARTESVLKQFRWLTPGAIGPETLVLFHGGSLQTRKGTQELLEAYRAEFGGPYRRRDDVRPDIVLMVQTSNTDWTRDYGRSLMGRIKDGPPILWCDHGLTITEQRQVYSLAHYSVMPNYCEGYGLMALESMACGVPTVVPRHTGNLETLDSRISVALEVFKPENVMGVRQTQTQGGKQVPCQWFKPDIAELREVMRTLYGARRAVLDSRAESIEMCVEHAARHPWETGAEALAQAFGLEVDLPARDGKLTVCTLACRDAQMVDTHALPTVGASKGLEFEHILVDNGSNEAPGMEAAANRWGAGYIRHDNPANFGVVATNFVWGPARTEFVARVDDDCTVEPNTLATMVRFLRENPEYGAVGCLGLYPDGLLWSSGAVWRGCPDLPGNRKPPTDSCLESRDMMGVTFSCVVVRTQAALEVGCISRDYVPCWHDDTDFCLALWAHGWPVRYLGTVRHTNEYSPTCGTPALRSKQAEKLGILKRHWQWLLDGAEPRYSDRIRGA